jgi:methionine-S-sulfoxide reductase
VYDVTVGYAGGQKPWPTYRNIMDYTEAVRISYDPNVITFEDLLDMFFQELGGPPISPSYSRQYASIILVHSHTQRAIAEAKVRGWSEKCGGRRLYIDIIDGTDFYRAEEYHQKYLEKQQIRRS